MALKIADVQMLGKKKNNENQEDKFLFGDQSYSRLEGGSGNDILVGDGLDLFGGAGSMNSLAQNGDASQRSILNNDAAVKWSAPKGSTFANASDYGFDDAEHGEVLELAAKKNASYEGVVSDIQPDAVVTLTFDIAAPNYGRGANRNGVEIVWNGETMLTSFPKAKDGWQTVTLELIGATDGVNTIGINGVGKNDDKGAVIDNVALVATADDIGEADRLSGAQGDDTLNGNGGDDWMEGGSGADQLNGGGGRDTAVYVKSPQAVDVDLTTGTGTGGNAEGDRYDSIENVQGSDFGDILTGDDGDNRLTGRDGDDQIFGEAGNDTLLGGRGADLLDGGRGTDTAEYDWSTSGVNVNLTTGLGQDGYAEGDRLVDIENLRGSFHDDTLTGNDAANRLFGDSGDDILSGMSGNDILIGGLGADVLIGGEGDRDAADYKNAAEGVSLDLVTGGSAGEALGDTFEGIEFVYGSSHRDIITGDDAVNRIVGGAGGDELFGAGGNDYILGGAGDDVMSGGAGNDVFELAADFGADTISDFEEGVGRTDRIWFRGLGLDENDLVMTDTTNGALIDAGSAGSLLLENVLVSDLHFDDFIF